MRSTRRRWRVYCWRLYAFMEGPEDELGRRDVSRPVGSGRLPSPDSNANFDVSEDDLKGAESDKHLIDRASYARCADYGDGTTSERDCGSGPEACAVRSAKP